MSQRVFSVSPSFVRQEIKGGDDNWYFYDIYHHGTNKRPYPEETIHQLTGSEIGSIYSVSYVSDGKTLNITFWLTAPFSMIVPRHHLPAYYAYFDVDSNKQTGWNGIDYIAAIQWNNSSKHWESTFSEVSDTGARIISKKNFSGFTTGGYYAVLSLDLAPMNYPSQYRIIFLAVDFIPDDKNPKISKKIIDFVNTVHIPPPKFVISTSPISANVTRGDQKPIEILVKSANPSSSIEGIQPSLYVYTTNLTNGIRLDVHSNRLIIPSYGLASLDSTLKVPTSVMPQAYTIPIFANISFPSEFFGNPTENISENSNLTIIVRDPLPIQTQIQNILSAWFTPLGTIATIVTIVSGVLGFGIGKKIRKSKNRKLDDWSLKV
jgi:hypothetical protein